MTKYPGNIHLSEYWFVVQSTHTPGAVEVSNDSISWEHSLVRVLVVVESTHTPGAVVGINDNVSQEPSLFPVLIVVQSTHIPGAVVCIK